MSVLLVMWIIGPGAVSSWAPTLTFSSTEECQRAASQISKEFDRVGRGDLYWVCIERKP